MDWSTLGPINLVHAGIVPSVVLDPGPPTVLDEARYTIRVFEASCNIEGAGFSNTVVVVNPVSGDVSGSFDPGGPFWMSPDGNTSIVTDVVAAIQGFGNSPGNPTKTRVDVDPCLVDFKIQILDIVRLIDSFRNVPSPFAPGAMDCPKNPCAG